MAGNEGVMDALMGLRKAGETIQLPQRGKKFLSPCQCLVYIGLMANVKSTFVRNSACLLLLFFACFVVWPVGRMFSSITCGEVR